MRKAIWVLVVLVAFVSWLPAQLVFERFEQPPDSNYIVQIVGGSDTSITRLSLETDTVYEGNSALKMSWQAEAAYTWGGFTKFELWNPDSNGVWDFSAFENLTIWYYVSKPTSEPGRAHFRIQLFDVSDAPVNTYDANQTELWYSFHQILDDQPGWHQIVLPLVDVGAWTWGEGFWLTGWAGISGNNHLDLDKIKGLGFEVSIDAPQDFHIVTGEILLDDLEFQGAAALNLVFFNGKVIPSDMQPFAWNSSITVEEGAGYTPGTNAIKWVQGAGQAWCGFGFNFGPKYMTLRWPLDTLKFKMKAPSGVGTLRVQFEDAHGNKIKKLLPEPAGGYGDTWHIFEIPLRDITEFEAGTSFDTSMVTVFQIMAEGTGNGSTLYFDDMWTGNPSIDVIPPSPPTALQVIPGDKSNLVTWLDSEGEQGETYTVYYSHLPITDVKAPEVEVAVMGQNIAENTGAYTHLLYTPRPDSVLSYYYAVTCTDAAGNESDPVVTPSPISNTGKYMPTISLNPPSNFAADGDLSEWAGIDPIRMFPSEGAHISANTKVDNDDDLSVLAYLAADADYLYVAFDVNDDVVDVSAANSWEQDSPDLFLGTYNWHGAPHSGYDRGDEPDYHFRFNKTQAIIDNLGSYVLLRDTSSNYYWDTKFPAGYVVEAKIAWADIAAAAGDKVFVPVNGYRVPIDFSINDADGGGVREGIMTLSPYNNDTSWQSPIYWVYTWIGTPTGPVSVDQPDNVALRYDLEQNYPNPFNPVTSIAYSLAKPGKVTLEVYNTLGQKVATIVDARQAAGRYVVRFDASQLASGIYFYKLSAGNFVKVRKMVLMK